MGYEKRLAKLICKKKIFFFFPSTSREQYERQTWWKNVSYDNNEIIDFPTNQGQLGCQSREHIKIFKWIFSVGIYLSFSLVSLSFSSLSNIVHIFSKRNFRFLFFFYPKRFISYYTSSYIALEVGLVLLVIIKKN